MGLRTKKGRGIGTSVELGQSSSATSAKESLNPPPERLQYYYAGLSLRAGGRGFFPATKRVAPGYFYWKIEEK